MNTKVKIIIGYIASFACMLLAVIFFFGAGINLGTSREQNQLRREMATLLEQYENMSTSTMNSSINSLQSTFDQAKIDIDAEDFLNKTEEVFRAMSDASWNTFDMLKSVGYVRTLANAIDDGVIEKLLRNYSSDDRTLERMFNEAAGAVHSLQLWMNIMYFGLLGLIIAFFVSLALSVFLILKKKGFGNCLFMIVSILLFAVFVVFMIRYAALFSKDAFGSNLSISSMLSTISYLPEKVSLNASAILLLVFAILAFVAWVFTYRTAIRFGETMPDFVVMAKRNKTINKAINKGRGAIDDYRSKQAFCPFCGGKIRLGDRVCIHCRRELPDEIRNGATASGGRAAEPNTYAPNGVDYNAGMPNTGSYNAGMPNAGGYNDAATNTGGYYGGTPGGYAGGTPVSSTPNPGSYAPNPRDTYPLDTEYASEPFAPNPEGYAPNGAERYAPETGESGSPTDGSKESGKWNGKKAMVFRKPGDLN